MIMHVLPLLVFTTFSGMAAGAYVIDALYGLGRTSGNRVLSDSKSTHAWLFPFVCLVLLGIGLCGTLAHLGQPLRFVNGLSNPVSMISQEAYWSIAFGIVIVIDLFLAKVRGRVPRPVRWVGAVVAVGLMFVTGLAYYQSLGVPAWSGAATLSLFVIGDLVLGASLCVLLERKGLTDRRLVCMNVAADIAFAVVLVSYGLYLTRIGTDMTALLIVAGLIGPMMSSAIAIATHSGKISTQVGGVAMFVFAAVGVVLARSVFFAAGML